MKTNGLTLDRGAVLGKAHVVDVRIPAKVAVDLDLEGIHQIERDLFDKLGHPGCYSGFDIRWRIEEHFVVDAARAVQYG